MGVIFLIIAGGMFGWMAAIIARVEDGRGLPLNLAAGVLGALVAGLAISPMIGVGELVAGNYHVGALLAGLAGSAGSLLALNLLRRDPAQGSARRTDLNRAASIAPTNEGKHR